MLEVKKLIDLINYNCGKYFLDSSFYLSEYSIGTYRNLKTEEYSINFRKNDRERVKVIKWFEDFWVFMEIRFVKTTTNITISIFQGKEGNQEKHQLFRAEWDDHNNPEERHSQPHWHITSQQVMEKTFKEYSSNIRDDNLKAYLNDIKSEIVDIKRFHFAMNGNWQNNENHIHSISSEEKVVKWFNGILSHLREELEYVNEK